MDDKEKIRRLKFSLERIDYFIAQAAREYLSNIPPIRLTFKNFLDLLITEIRKQERAKVEKKYLEGAVRKKIDLSINQHVRELVREKLEQSLFLPILIKPVVNEVSIDRWRAISVKGSVRHTKGATPEEAYASLKDRMLSSITGDAVSFLMMKINDPIYSDYLKARPFLEEDYSGIKIKVRIKDEKKKEEVKGA